MTATRHAGLGSGLFRRVYLGYVAVILAVTGVLGILIETRVRADMDEDFGLRLETEADYLRELVAPWFGPAPRRDPAELQEVLRRLSGQLATRLTVIDADGTVLADTSRDPAAMDDHGQRPEVVAAREFGAGRARRFSSTLGTELLYVALAVPPAAPASAPAGGPAPDPPPAGFVRAALPLDRVDERLGELRGLVLIGAGVAAVIGLLLGLVLARRLSAPVAAITSAVESISRGGYGRVERPDSEDELGRLVGAVNRMSDELRDRMATITADRNKLLAVLGGMVEGVVAVDREERVVHMNAVAGRLLGVRPVDSAGKRIWEVTRAVEIPEILERTGGTDEVTGSVELRVEGSSEPRVIELVASPLLDASGRRAGAVVVLHDVTELRRLEQVRRDFVANVSHELKTPLTAIRGLVETVIDDEQMEPATARRFALKIRDQVARLSMLVTDLLTLARVESTQGSRERPVIDLAAPVRECARRFAPLSAAEGVELVLSLPDEPIPLRADEEDLRQIVGNLLDNAIKYTPAGGRVDLVVVPGTSEVTVEVRDTGLGIEPRDQDRVFERFYRVDKARSRELGGTGLGLSIVKHLVQSLDGAISLESAPGRGSRFRVRLPLARPGI